MEFNRPVLGRVAILRQNAEGLEDTDSAGTVIVSARGGQQGKKIIGRILVRTNDGQRLGEAANFRLEACNN